MQCSLRCPADFVWPKADYVEPTAETLVKGDWLCMNPRKDYQAALALRIKGKTYGEIRKAFGIPKSTQSSWFKKLELPKSAIKILQKKQRTGLIALGEFNKSRTLANQLENESIRLKYEKIVSRLSDRELMLVGASLYW